MTSGANHGFCGSCGSPRLADGQLFCHKCGAPDTPPGEPLAGDVVLEAGSGRLAGRHLPVRKLLLALMLPWLLSSVGTYAGLHLVPGLAAGQASTTPAHGTPAASSSSPAGASPSAAATPAVGTVSVEPAVIDCSSLEDVVLTIALPPLAVDPDTFSTYFVYWAPNVSGGAKIMPGDLQSAGDGGVRFTYVDSNGWATCQAAQVTTQRTVWIEDTEGNVLATGTYSVAR
jgi:hypothetical protein